MKALLRRLFQLAYRRYAVRENVAVASDVHIGPGSTLWAPHSLQVGADVYIGKRCTIEVDGVIGPGCLIANDVGIVGRRDHAFRTIGVSVRRAPWIGDLEGPDGGRVIVGPDVWIGYGAIILGPVTIGRGAVVAAGAVVISDVAPYTIVGGNPARELAGRFDAEARAVHEDRLYGAQRRSAR